MNSGVLGRPLTCRAAWQLREPALPVSDDLSAYVQAHGVGRQLGRHTYRGWEERGVSHPEPLEVVMSPCAVDRRDGRIIPHRDRGHRMNRGEGHLAAVYLEVTKVTKVLTWSEGEGCGGGHHDAPGPRREEQLRADLEAKR